MSGASKLLAFAVALACCRGSNTAAPTPAASNDSLQIAGVFRFFLHTTGKIGVVGVVGLFEVVDGVLRHVRHLGSDAGAEETRTSSKRPRKHSPGFMYVHTTQQRTGDGKDSGARGTGIGGALSLGFAGIGRVYPTKRGRNMYSVITAQATLDGFS